MTFEEWWDEQMQFLYAKEVAQGAWDAANKTNVWKRALDNELVLWGKLTPEEATFKEAIDTLRTLLLITQSVATDPLVNGGYVLVPVEPTEKMVEAGLMFHTQFDSSVPRVYRAMIYDAQEGS